MQVHLIDGTTVNLTDVERDDEQAVIGTTNSGKRAVFARDRLATGEPTEQGEPQYVEVPAGRHPFRVYLKGGEVLRVVDPPFESVEAFYLGEVEDELNLTTENGLVRPVHRENVLSVLSARPQDQQQAAAYANGNGADAEVEDAEPSEA